MTNKNIIKKNSGFVNNWVIVAALIIIAAIGVIYYNYYSKNAVPGSPVSPPVVQREEVVKEQPEAAKPESELVVVSLSADKKEYSLNELVNVDILLALADKKTPGVDVLIKYDPKSLELQKTAGGALQTSGVVSNPKQILKTTNSSFKTFPYLKANILDGLIFFSALDKPKEYVTGDASIASIVFKAVKKENTKISLIFDKNKSLDTEVFYMGNAILDKAIDAEMVIK